MNISAQTKICMIIGDPVNHSLSPAMHNAGYVELGIDSEFVFVGSLVTPEKLENAVSGFRALQIKGVSVTIPHKTTIMNYLDEVDETAKEIGAVNTIVNENNKLKGYNTDWQGVVKPLEELVNLSGKKIALLGAGGAARSVIYGIIKKGGKITIFNRSIEKAQALAEEFNCAYAALDELHGVKNMDVIFNATSVGLHPQADQTPLPKEYITSDHIVFDAIYTPYDTQLLKDAKAQGAQVIHGQSMLLYQGLAQFKQFTGHDAPEDIMREILESPRMTVL